VETINIIINPIFNQINTKIKSNEYVKYAKEKKEGLKANDLKYMD